MSEPGLFFCIGDHPRLCGEKATHYLTSKQNLRITPAYAGKSTIINVEFDPNGGSPPPMRGKVERRTVDRSIPRITPAYAGKRITRHFQMDMYGDHPRLCGEKVQTASGIAPMTGSPPPMRGKACKTGQGHAKRGITPAYAGKSSDRRSSGNAMRDHPRLCGEKESGF